MPRCHHGSRDKENHRTHRVKEKEISFEYRQACAQNGRNEEGSSENGGEEGRDDRSPSYRYSPASQSQRSRADGGE